MLTSFITTFFLCYGKNYKFFYFSISFSIIYVFISDYVFVNISISIGSPFISLFIFNKELQHKNISYTL